MSDLVAIELCQGLPAVGGTKSSVGLVTRGQCCWMPGVDGLRRLGSIIIVETRAGPVLTPPSISKMGGKQPSLAGREKMRGGGPPILAAPNGLKVSARRGLPVLGRGEEGDLAKLPLTQTLQVV